MTEHTEEYTPIDPEHYRKTPLHIGLECVNYIYGLPYTQGCAAKYVYRAGNKDILSQELSKATWYLKESFERDSFESFRTIYDVGYSTKLTNSFDDITPITEFWTEYPRHVLFYTIIDGEVDAADEALQRILDGSARLVN